MGIGIWRNGEKCKFYTFSPFCPSLFLPRNPLPGYQITSSSSTVQHDHYYYARPLAIDRCDPSNEFVILPIFLSLDIYHCHCPSKASLSLLPSATTTLCHACGISSGIYDTDFTQGFTCKMSHAKISLFRSPLLSLSTLYIIMIDEIPRQATFTKSLQLALPPPAARHSIFICILHELILQLGLKTSCSILSGSLEQQVFSKK